MQCIMLWQHLLGIICYLESLILGVLLVKIKGAFYSPKFCWTSPNLFLYLSVTFFTYWNLLLIETNLNLLKLQTHTKPVSISTLFFCYPKKCLYILLSAQLWEHDCQFDGGFSWCLNIILHGCIVCKKHNTVYAFGR